MKRLLFSTVLLSFFLALSCEKEDRYLLRFNHNLHVVDLEMECAACHGDLDEGRFAAADHDACTDCHEEWTEADEISRETCGMCHVEKDLDTIGEAAEITKPTRGVFQHTETLDGQCDLCHGDLLGEGVEFVKVSSRADIVAMRDTAHASNRSCTSCHEDLDVDVAPANHRQNWTRRHGGFSADEDAVCTLCHAQQSCQECHRFQQPSSHTNLFRLQTHGIEASWSREKCMVCHRQDSCDSCHSEVKPRSHTAAWRQRHCLQCHSSQAMGSGCETCHRGGIEVHEDLAPPAFHADLSELVRFDCLRSGCHNPVDGDPGVRLVPSRHPFLEDTQCLSCHRL